MKKKNFKSLVCVGMLVCMMGCSAGDTGANESSTELTGQVEENIQDTTEDNLQTDAENELDASQTEDMQESVTEPDATTTDEMVEEDAVTENQTAEGTEVESTPEEPEVEMVDFETWAKQEGNEEPCLVVWNEELETREIIPIFEETMEFYTIQVDDKFAIPYNKKIIAVIVNEESISFSSKDYLEISLEAGKLNQVAIGYKDKQGETETKNYLLE